MGGLNSKHNLNILQTLRRGDIIKVEKPDGNKYYIYGGSWDKVYPLTKDSRACFAREENTIDDGTAISFISACGDSRCYKSSEVEWMKENGCGSLSALDYNKKLLMALLPGDIVKIKWHNLLYIGDGKVVHMIGKKCFSGKYLPRRYQEKLADHPGVNGLIIDDSFLALGQKTKAYKANRSDLHGLPFKMVIQRALSQLGPAEFRFWGKNCKHFVDFMKYGFQVSNKIESFAIGKDPSILCLDQQNLESMTNNVPVLDQASEGNDNHEVSTEDNPMLDDLAEDFELIEMTDYEEEHRV